VTTHVLYQFHYSPVSTKKSFETEYYFLFLKDEATWESIKLAKDPIKKPRNMGPV